MDNREKIVNAVASVGHEEWRKGWKEANGDAPRIKTTTDEAWIKKNGTDQVNIAALSYEQLPSDWQKENRLAGEATADALLAAKEQRRPFDSQLMEEVADHLHAKWLERNGSWAPPEQSVPYAQLSEAEKEKDRLFVRAGFDAIQRVLAAPVR